MSDCIFCKIVAGELPASVVYENSDIIAFLDINPVHPGHTLVIPRTHYADIYETPENVLAEVMSVSKRIALAIKEAVGADGTNIQINNDRVAGQVIPHMHVHVTPRFEGDGLKLWPQDTYADGEMEKVREKLQAAITR